MEWKIVPLTTGKMLMFLLDKNSKQYFEKVHFILKDQYLKCKMVSKMITYFLFSDSSIFATKPMDKKRTCVKWIGFTYSWKILIHSSVDCLR